MGPNIIPIACANELDFMRLESLINRINSEASKYPLEYHVAARSDTGIVYVDLWAESPAKLQYLSEEWSKYSAAAQSFEQQLVEKNIITPSFMTLYYQISSEDMDKLKEKSKEDTDGFDEIEFIFHEHAPGDPLSIWEKVKIFFLRR